MDHQPVLKRKVMHARPKAVSAPPPHPLVHALPRALMRAFSAATGLTCQAGAPTLSRVVLDEAGELLPDDGFVAILSNPDPEGAGGLIAMEGGLFVALVEAMTIGRLLPRAAALRRPTSTDAALLGAAVDRLLAELAAPPAELVANGDEPAPPSPPPPLGAGWRLMRHVTDLRLLSALMEAGSYDMARIPITLSGGEATRSGGLQLLLPTPPPAAPAAPLRVVEPAPDGAEDADSVLTMPMGDDNDNDALEKRILAAPVALNGILGRVVLPLSQVMKLKPGQRFEFPMARLEEVEVTGLDDRTRALARLGQWRGMRALRIVTVSETAGPMVHRILPEGSDRAGGFIPAHPLGAGPES